MDGHPQRLLTYGRQCIDESDERAILEVLRSPWLTQGPYVEKFERALVDRFGSKHAVVCSNGTAALHLAALALGWQPGDVILVPAITFVASANCAVYVGAEPHFVDIDPRTLAIDPMLAEKAVRDLRAAGRRVRAIVGVDMAGHPADWGALRSIADRHDLQLVDDACHALGATYANGTRRIGDGVHADVTMLSFHPVKHITTGEGGAILTNDARLADRLALLRSHGIRRGETQVEGWEGPWHLDMTEMGFNYRLSDLQCGLGLSQLAKLDGFLARRRAIAAEYAAAFAGEPAFALPMTAPGMDHAWHLHVLRAKFSQPHGRKRFFAACLERGIQLQVHYRPVPLNTFYRKRLPADVMQSLPHSQHYYDECFSIPMFPQLKTEEIAHVVRTLREVYAVEANR
jgi:perosamine synthetase